MDAKNRAGINQKPPSNCSFQFNSIMFNIPKEERDLNQMLTDCTELKSVANEIDQKT